MPIPSRGPGLQWFAARSLDALLEADMTRGQVVKVIIDKAWDPGKGGSWHPGRSKLDTTTHALVPSQ